MKQIFVSPCSMDSYPLSIFYFFWDAGRNGGRGRGVGHGRCFSRCCISLPPAASARGGRSRAAQASASGQAPTACVQLGRACELLVSDCLRSMPHVRWNRLIVTKSLIVTLSIMLSYSIPAPVLMHRNGSYPQAIIADLWISGHLFALACG